ncbi:MAG TPA: gamma carbonic anhydrase family protein [Gemmatimonadales bacterium]|nr:gamma carbonic anhydrase family protein [Gemmatimonadales bacterium]
MPTIDPSAWIAPNATVLFDVTIGARSSIWYQTVMRGDADRIVIGSDCNVQDLTMVHVDEGVPCLIGSRVSIGHRAIIHGCTLEDDTLIGMGAILLNGAVVKRGAVVGAGALVREGQVIEADTLVVGSPARMVRRVDAELARRREATWEHYVRQMERHRG